MKKRITKKYIGTTNLDRNNKQNKQLQYAFSLINKR